jgi:hypothetical protein
MEIIFHSKSSVSRYYRGLAIKRIGCAANAFNAHGNCPYHGLLPKPVADNIHRFV